MAKTRDIDRVQLHADPWKPMRPRPAKAFVNGLDTETKNGYARLLTWSTPAVDGCIELDGFDDFLQFALHDNVTKGINFFYNVDFDFSAIAKHLGRDAVMDLAAAQITHTGPYEIKWIPDKAFTITEIRNGRRRRNASFYDCAQFYEKQRLATAAKNVGEEKMEFDTAAIDWDQYDKDPPARMDMVLAIPHHPPKERVARMKKWRFTYRETMLAYGALDARICRLLGERLHRSVNAVVPVHQYYSTATIAQTFFLARLKRQIPLPPHDVLDAALRSYGGGRFELVRKGWFERDVYEIDINSAYPAEFARLAAMGTGTGSWRKVKGDWDPSALYGFYNVTVKTHGYLLSPIMHRVKDTILYPHGTHDAWLEKSEMRVLDRLGFRPIVHHGVEYHDRAPDTPFGFVADDYDERKRLASTGREDLAYVYKIALNSAYGKTIQLVPDLTVLDNLPLDYEEDSIVREIERDDGRVLFVVRRGWRAGKMFNPVFAAAITARVRSRLIETVLDHKLEDSLIGFATDAMFLDKRPPASLLGKGLGAWKLEAGPTQALFIGSGVYALRDPKKHEDHAMLAKEGRTCKGCINRFRGFHTKRDLMDAVRQGVLAFEGEAPVKLKEGARGGRRNRVKGTAEQFDWRDIGRFLPQTKTLDPNFDRKRVWARQVQKPMDLFDGRIESVPVVI